MYTEIINEFQHTYRYDYYDMYESFDNLPDISDELLKAIEDDPSIPDNEYYEAEEALYEIEHKADFLRREAGQDSEECISAIHEWYGTIQGIMEELKILP